MKTSKEDKLKRIKVQKKAEKDRKKAKIKAESKLNPFTLAQEREWQRRGNIRHKKKKAGDLTRQQQRRATKGLRKIA